MAYKKRRTSRKKVEQEKVKQKKLIETKYYAIYRGAHRHMTISGIGRIIPGKKYPISKHRADSFRPFDFWEVSEESIYEEIDN